MRKHWILGALVVIVVVSAPSWPTPWIIGVGLAPFGVVAALVAGALAIIRSPRVLPANRTAGMIVAAMMAVAALGWWPDLQMLLLLIGLPGVVAALVAYLCGLVVFGDALGWPPARALVFVAMCGSCWLVNTAALTALLALALRARPHVRATT